MNIVKVYSGKSGACMCGCAGKWSYTEHGAKTDNPGYEPDISERSVKIIANKVLGNNDAVKEDNYVYVDDGKRIRVVYYN
jgi:hypothetical protein